MKVITIGRNPANNVVIDDPRVSRHHLQIIQDDYGNFSVADFGSRNGTFVNGKRVTGEVRLSPGDIILIGNTTLPWNSYFPVNVPPPVPAPESNGESSPTNLHAIAVLLLGLVSSGSIVYIVVNYFTSFGNRIAGMFGGLEGSLKLFPIYLKGYFGIGGQWIPMIAALALGITAYIVDNMLKKKSCLSQTGKIMAIIAYGMAVLFLILALFAEQTVKLY
jgi:hypothetical protein